MLHYKYFGRDYLVQRHAELNARRRERDVKMEYGFQYDPAYTIKHFEELLAARGEVTPEQQGIMARFQRRFKGTRTLR